MTAWWKENPHILHRETKALVPKGTTAQWPQEILAACGSAECQACANHFTAILANTGGSHFPQRISEGPRSWWIYLIQNSHQVDNSDKRGQTGHFCRLRRGCDVAMVPYSVQFSWDKFKNPLLYISTYFFSDSQDLQLRHSEPYSYFLWHYLNLHYSNWHTCLEPNCVINPILQMKTGFRSWLFSLGEN